VRPTPDQWDGAYNDSWVGVLVPPAFAHPAKFSKSLIFKIVEHALACGWVQAGDVCLDPFSGVALGAFPLNLYGLHYVGVELEERFHVLAQANVTYWQQKWGHRPGYGTTWLVHGDSRHLLALVQGQVDAVVGSPPYAGSLHLNESVEADIARMHRKNIPCTGGATSRHGLPNQHHNQGYGTDPAQLGNLPAGSVDAVVGSPPYAGSFHGQDESLSVGERIARTSTTTPGTTGRNSQINHPRGYGSDPAQLGNLPAGSVDAVVGSPPYAGLGMQEQSSTIDTPPRPGDIRQYRRKAPIRPYSVNPVNLGNLPPGQVDAVVGSPPYAASDQNYAAGWTRINRRKGHARGPCAHNQASYGTSPGQLGNGHGLTFWEAARTILEQVAALLKPGGVAIWVTKRYVRDGQLVEFSQDWARLNQACGLVWLHWHQALLVEACGEQATLFGAPEQVRSEKKSFFRRLVEKKGTPRIDWEDVLCFQKPGPPVAGGRGKP
jgi:hypothetical protein